MFGSVTGLDHPLFGELRRLEQELDEIFGGSASWGGGIRSLPRGSFPAVNVGGTADCVSVYLFAPGIDPKEMELSLQQNLLTVSGNRSVSLEKDATYYRQERWGGTFRRVISLPEDIDPEKIAAKYQDGIVQITLPRRESARPRQISIG